MNLYNKTTALKVVLYEMWAINKNIIISIPIIVFAIFVGAAFWSGAPLHEQFINKENFRTNLFYENLLIRPNQGKVFVILTIPAFLMLTLRGYLIQLNESFNTLTYPISPSERVIGIGLFTGFTYLLTIVSIILFDHLLVALYKHLYLEDTRTYLEHQGQFYYQFGEYSAFNTITTLQLKIFSTVLLMIIPSYALFVFMLKKYATMAFIVLGIGAYIFVMTFTQVNPEGTIQYTIDGTAVKLWRYIYYLLLVFMILLSFYYKLKEKEH
ncbi:hypothetical protein [Sphingobacterium faecale]|uniref:ABC transporter permease n=1 Tax=Sphingobacterium faecale TaxID=2803775 RepID=A0ABS1R9I1_9SPHI|nr:hypothetical protein [Sphingobacterium faecale]MBL1411180.1 hypothetical protein [Sphingobacterium faecale]